MIDENKARARQDFVKGRGRELSREGTEERGVFGLWSLVSGLWSLVFVFYHVFVALSFAFVCALSLTCFVCYIWDSFVPSVRRTRSTEPFVLKN
jgi:hypothetical protein